MSVTYTSRVMPTASMIELRVRDVARRGATSILAKSQQRVPVDTGKLKRSSSARLGVTTFTVQYSQPYAVYVEMGTRHMSAQPYLRPAFDEGVAAMYAQWKGMLA